MGAEVAGVMNMWCKDDATLCTLVRWTPRPLASSQLGSIFVWDSGCWPLLLSATFWNMHKSLLPALQKGAPVLQRYSYKHTALVGGTCIFPCIVNMINSLYGMPLLRALHNIPFAKNLPCTPSHGTDFLCALSLSRQVAWAKLGYSPARRLPRLALQSSPQWRLGFLKVVKCLQTLSLTMDTHYHSTWNTKWLARCYWSILCNQSSKRRALWVIGWFTAAEAS